MSIPLWRLNLQPASFNGVGFKVDVDAKSSGRRIVQHEFPKRDTGYAEDMGRKIRNFQVTAYIISGPNESDYQSSRDDLIAVLEAEGAGLLIHPTLGTDMVVVGPYTVTERRERGGIAEFEISFIEAGRQAFFTPVLDTASTATSAAQSSISSFQNSSDITGIDV